jgi:hypothetical protein
MIQRPPINITKGEVLNLAWDWSGELEEKATTLVTSAWESSDSNISLSTKSILGNKAKVTITAANDVSGTRQTITNTVTLANGETIIAWAYFA